MKITIFLFIAIFVYVDADVYTINVDDLKPQNEKVLSVASQSDGENSKNCSEEYAIIREGIPDSGLYDGYGVYVDTNVSKTVQFCNVDLSEVSGTMSYILLTALGLYNDSEVACPIVKTEACTQSQFKMVSGNFDGIFDGSFDATLEIHLPALIRAQFSISRKEGPPEPEVETDSSAEEQNEMEKEIEEAAAEEGDTEAAGEQAAAEEEAGTEEEAAAEEEATAEKEAAEEYEEYNN